MPDVLATRGVYERKEREEGTSDKSVEQKNDM